MLGKIKGEEGLAEGGAEEFIMGIPKETRTAVSEEETKRENLYV